MSATLLVRECLLALMVAGQKLESESSAGSLVRTGGGLQGTSPNQSEVVVAVLVQGICIL